MKTILKLLTVFAIAISATCFGQSTAISSSILNLGSDVCGDRYGTSFAAIGSPLGAPFMISNCAVNPPFTNIFSKFIAYNPRDNRVYINNIENNDSRIYIYDMGLPLNYTCPAVMPLTPNYQYWYVPNNFEFDVNGDLWSIRALAGDNAIIERLDEATGTILFSKTINFPAGNSPNTLGSGDIVLIPNGRLFIVMGDAPGKLYEITNYNTAIGNATANFIQTMPRPCFGILYINGKLELTGTDLGGSCYRYLYDIPTQVMGPELPFQLGITPIDNSSISPAVGLSKNLVGSTTIDSSTADIVYEIFAKNLGNVWLRDFNITDDLTAVFGVGNVSNVSTSIMPGQNPNNLTLNPAYNGVTDINILNSNQSMTNLTNGYIGVRVSLRASNLINNTIYYNTAKALGDIGNGSLKVAVIDSSNNGDKTVLDPNLDGDAGDIGENKPTPYYFGYILPIRFLDTKADRINKNQHRVLWTIAAPANPVAKFEVEFSEDNIHWQAAGTVPAVAGKNSYYLDNITSSTNNIYYRVKAIEVAGRNFMSTEVLVRRIEESQEIKISPNPADESFTIYAPADEIPEGRRMNMVDVNGKKIVDLPFVKKYMDVKTSSFPNGYYVVNIADATGNVVSIKVLVRHK